MLFAHGPVVVLIEIAVTVEGGAGGTQCEPAFWLLPSPSWPLPSWPLPSWQWPSSSDNTAMVGAVVVKAVTVPGLAHTKAASTNAAIAKADATIFAVVAKCRVKRCARSLTPSRTTRWPVSASAVRGRTDCYAWICQSCNGLHTETRRLARDR